MEILLDKNFLKEKEAAIKSAIESGVNSVFKSHMDSDPGLISFVLHSTNQKEVQKIVWNRIKEKSKTPTCVTRDWFLNQAKIVALCVISQGGVVNTKPNNGDLNHENK